MNLYAFVRNQPVDKIDILGLIDQRKVLDGRILYSCKCGWIDADHVGTQGVAEAALVAIDRYEIDKGRDTFSLEASQGALRGHIQTGVRVTYQLTYGNPLLYEPLTTHDKNELALAIFLNIERRFERHQGFNSYWSSYSVEDMPSNYLGFLLATGDISSVKEACDPLSKEDSMRMFKYGYGPEKNREIQPKLWTYVGFRVHPAGIIDIDPAAKSDPANCDPCKRKDKTKPKFFDLYSPSQKSGYFQATQVDFLRFNP